MSNSRYEPSKGLLGGYTSNDGTIEFYGRINAILPEDALIVDLGAGRAAWFEDDRCSYRRDVRTLKGKAREVVGIDIDAAVLNNNSTDRNMVMESETLPFSDGTVDMVVADFVLEHVEDPIAFASEVRRVLRSGGLFCARTPHKYHYVAIGARLVKNVLHTKVLNRLQPDRKDEDVFPTCYRLNTHSGIRKSFPDFEDFTYLFMGEPAYFFGKRWLYKCMAATHLLAPKFFSGNLFIFLRKT